MLLLAFLVVHLAVAADASWAVVEELDNLVQFQLLSRNYDEIFRDINSYYNIINFLEAKIFHPSVHAMLSTMPPLPHLSTHLVI